MIRWTTREWRLIADRLVKEGVDPDKHGWRTAVRVAMMEGLPEDRWREPHSLNDAKKTLIPLMREVRDNPKSEDVLNLGPVQCTPEPPSAENLSTEELLVELARRIAHLLEPQKTNPVDRGFHPKHNPFCEVAPRPPSRRFLIIGPKGQQQEFLRKIFPNFKLIFVTCEDNPKACAVGVVEEAILWTKFMKHAQQEAVEALGYKRWFANTMDEIEARLRSHG